MTPVGRQARCDNAIHNTRKDKFHTFLLRDLSVLPGIKTQQARLELMQIRAGRRRGTMSMMFAWTNGSSGHGVATRQRTRSCRIEMMPGVFHPFAKVLSRQRRKPDDAVEMDIQARLSRRAQLMSEMIWPSDNLMMRSASWKYWSSWVMISTVLPRRLRSGSNSS